MHRARTFRSADRKSQLLHWQILEDWWNVWELVVIPYHSIAFQGHGNKQHGMCVSRVKDTKLSIALLVFIDGHWKNWKTFPKPKFKNDKFHTKKWPQVLQVNQQHTRFLFEAGHTHCQDILELRWVIKFPTQFLPELQQVSYRMTGEGHLSSL